MNGHVEVARMLITEFAADVNIRNNVSCDCKLVYIYESICLHTIYLLLMWLNSKFQIKWKNNKLFFWSFEFFKCFHDISFIVDLDVVACGWIASDDCLIILSILIVSSIVPAFINYWVLFYRRDSQHFIGHLILVMLK